MLTHDGLSLHDSSLSAVELKQLQETLNPYLIQLRMLEYQVGSIRQVISDLTRMYLDTLGSDSHLTVNLKTGRLSQSVAPDGSGSGD